MSDRTVRIEAGEWTKFLALVQKKLQKPSELLRAAFATRGFRAIIDKFQQEIGPNGKWAPRKASTNKRYDQIRAGLKSGRKMSRRDARKRYGSVESAFAAGQDIYRERIGGIPRSAFDSRNRLLQLTGNLRKSIMPGSLNKQTEIIDSERVMVFSPVPYSGQHDEGDPSRNLPARTFMWLNEKEKDDMGNIILKLAVGAA